MKRKGIVVLMAITAFISAAGAMRPSATPHCAEDEAKVLSILEKLSSGNRNPGEKMAAAAMMLEGSGEDSYYRTDSTASLRINVDTFSPLMFVNNVIALSKASGNPGGPEIASFFSEFENIACRRGEFTGYPSIMFHGADWIGDNSARGNITELTENYDGVVARTKSLDEMTRKRGDFAALSDSSTFESVRMVEMGFRTHRIPSLKKETIKKKEIMEDLREGDIILLVPNRDGIDIYDIGVITFEEGKPYLIHLSPQTHSVVKEKEELARYMGLMTKHFQGYRIIRVNDF